MPLTKSNTTEAENPNFHNIKAKNQDELEDSNENTNQDDIIEEDVNIFHSDNKDDETSNDNIDSVYALTTYDPLHAYLEEIKKYPLLTPEEEQKISLKFYKYQDISSAVKLVTSNLRLVVKIALEYRKAYNNLMDLIQEGNIGLMQAIKKFDPYRGVKLSSYGAWWIRAYILRFILNNWRMVKIGTTQTQRKLFFNLSKEKARLEAMGIEPTSNKIAEQLGVEEQEVIDMDNRLAGNDVSLNIPIKEDEGKGTTRMDMISDADEDRIDDALAIRELNETLKDKLRDFGNNLKGKEEYIFNNRLIAEDPMTLQEIGNNFSITRERVRQIEKRLLDKLKKYLLKEMNEHFN